MQISEQFDFFDDEISPVRDDDFPSEGETKNKLKDIKIYYEEPVLETESVIEDDQELFETEQKISKVDFKQQKIKK